MAYSFDTAGDEISYGDVASISGSFTIYAHFTIDAESNAQRQILSWYAGGAVDIWLEFYNSGTNVLAFGFVDTTYGAWPDTTWTTGFTAGSTHRVWGVWNGTTMRIYADADTTHKSTTTPANGPGVGTGHLRLGNNPAFSRLLAGDIHEFAIFDRAITAGEQLGMNAGFSAAFYRPYIYMPLIRQSHELRKGLTGTVSGATVATHARIIYPSYAKGRSFTTASGGASYTPTLTDIFTLVDTVPRSTSRSFIDVASLVDSLPKSTNRTLTDASTLVDSVIKATGKTLSDVFTMAEVFAINIVGRTLSETVTLVESLPKAISRTLTDVSTLVDTVVKSTSRTLTDVVTAVDTFLSQIGFTKELLETITMVETFIKDTARTLTDTASMVDTIPKTVSRTLSEVATLVDTLVKSFSRELSEVISLVEVFTRSISRTLSESFSLVETFINGMTQAYAAILTETVTLVDTTVRATNKVFTETVRISDWVWQKLVKGSAGFIKQVASSTTWRKPL